MASEQLDAAMDLWKAGDLDRAAALFRQIAATGDPEASHLLAGLLQESGDLEGAEAAHRSVIQSGDPVFGQRSAIAMGMMLVTAEEWAAAHRVLMIASDGADFEVAALADTALVLVLTQLGDAQGAQESLERARRCNSPAVAELAARLELPEFDQDPASARDRYEEAEDEDDYEELLTCGDPEIVALAAFRLYQIHAENDDFDAAREACEHAIAVGSPEHRAMAHKLLGAVLVDLGEYAESAAAYRVAAEDPRPDLRLPALIELAKVTAQLGDEEETKAIFHRVIASGHREYAAQAQVCLAQMHTEAGEPAEALAALRAVLESGDDEWSAAGVTLLGLLLDQHPEARDAIMEVLGLAAGHDDQDTAFKAALLLDHAARQQPLADPVEEQALQDTDDGMAALKAGELAEARRLLRRAADSGAPAQSLRAMVVLAKLELGEGDREQADELLSYVAEGDEVLQGFNAAFLLHLLRSSAAEPHPVLGAMLDHQRLGREEGLARYQEAARHPDPAVAAIGTAVFAQVLASIGCDLSEVSELLLSAAGSGEPLALSYTAMICKDVLADRERAAGLLGEALAQGHPALAPWVGWTLGGLVAEDDPGQARAAYEVAFESGHRGLRFEAAAGLTGVYERQGDLLAACRLHERLIAEGEPERGALPLAYNRIRLDDVAGARAAFELGDDELCAFGRLVLDRDFEGAARALPEGEELAMAGVLAMECASAWQHTGRIEAADGALALVAAAGHPAQRQQAGCLLGALRGDAGDRRGAVEAFLGTLGEDEHLNGVALRSAGELLRELGEHAEAVAVLDRVPEPDREVTLMAAGSLVACGRVTEARERLTAAYGAGAYERGAGAGVYERGAGAGVYGRGAGVDVAPGGEAALHLARLLRERGDAEAALAVLRDAPPEVSALSECLLGSLLAETGDLPGARAAYERAAALDPETEPAVMVEAGRCLLAAGDTEPGYFALERAAAQEDDPHAAAVARHLLGRAVPEELPWVLLAEGDRPGALAALTGLTGSEPLAALLLALHDDDVREVRRLFAGLGPEDRARALDEIMAKTPGTTVLHRLIMEEGEPEPAAIAAIDLGAAIAEKGDNCRAELCFLTATGHPATAGVAWRNIAAVRHLRGDLDGALEAAMNGLPDTADIAADLLTDRGDAARARRLLAEAAAAGDLACRRSLLLHLLNEQDHGAAIEEAERAVGSGDPETVAMGYWAWGVALGARGEVRQAAAMYAKGIDAGHPELSASLRLDLATALRELGDTIGAERELSLAIASGHPYAAAKARVQLGVWLYEEGLPLAAARSFAAALGTGMAATALDALNDISQELCDGGEHAPALEVLSLMGEHAAAQARELGARCTDPLAVVRYYELAGADPYTELEAAGRLAELGETAAARACYERLNEHEDPDVRFVAGGRLLELLDSAGDTEAFYDLAERRAGDADSPAPGVFGSLLGMLQERQGDTEASLRTLREAAENGEPTTLSVYAQTLVGAGHVDEGRQVYLRVLDAGDDDLAARAMIALGQTYHEEDEERAHAWYRRAVEESEGHVSALGAMYLGALAKRNRNFPEALTWYQRVIDAGDPESGMAAAHLGELCYWLGDRDGALRYYELTLGLSEQPELVAEAACRLGEIQYERGDLERARRLLTQAIETGEATFAAEAKTLLAKLA
ncbi:tetratricopeptide repeat protein [Nonomuraea sp. PA05]|uniref:tetratricopeptide repeat protein n=1 Tax=Nonomuraea sp. PA05 TaxID=2604466 RepID=UPI0011D9048C|nr:tetratricopeptide repeat protein [Nonomuraea sp. PA05]TYB66100.1 tetratricopeptide repeat protein [Nonomuraea sp. PA05]